jgi:hypothetical protein
MMASRAKAAGYHEEALKLYSELVGLLDDPKLRQEKMAPGTKNGVRSLPLSLLLRKRDQWAAAVVDYLKAIGRAGELG